MLKITCIAEDGESVTLKLEGRIAGQGGDALRKECDSHLARHNTIILDLSELSFVDQHGVDTLKALMSQISQHVQVVGCSLFVSGLLHGESD